MATVAPVVVAPAPFAPPTENTTSAAPASKLPPGYSGQPSYTRGPTRAFIAVLLALVDSQPQEARIIEVVFELLPIAAIFVEWLQLMSLVGVDVFALPTWLTQILSGFSLNFPFLNIADQFDIGLFYTACIMCGLALFLILIVAYCFMVGWRGAPWIVLVTLRVFARILATMLFLPIVRVMLTVGCTPAGVCSPGRVFLAVVGLIILLPLCFAVVANAYTADPAAFDPTRRENTRFDIINIVFRLIASVAAVFVKPVSHVALLYILLVLSILYNTFLSLIQPYFSVWLMRVRTGLFAVLTMWCISALIIAYSPSLSEGTGAVTMLVPIVPAFLIGFFAFTTRSRSWRVNVFLALKFRVVELGHSAMLIHNYHLESLMNSPSRLGQYANFLSTFEHDDDAAEGYYYKANRYGIRGVHVQDYGVWESRVMQGLRDFIPDIWFLDYVLNTIRNKPSFRFITTEASHNINLNQLLFYWRRRLRLKNVTMLWTRSVGRSGDQTFPATLQQLLWSVLGGERAATMGHNVMVWEMKRYLNTMGCKFTEEEMTTLLNIVGLKESEWRANDFDEGAWSQAVAAFVRALANAPTAAMAAQAETLSAAEIAAPVGPVAAAPIPAIPAPGTPAAPLKMHTVVIMLETATAADETSERVLRRLPGLLVKVPVMVIVHKPYHPLRHKGSLLRLESKTSNHGMIKVHESANVALLAQPNVTEIQEDDDIFDERFSWVGEVDDGYTVRIGSETNDTSNDFVQREMIRHVITPERGPLCYHCAVSFDGDALNENGEIAHNTVDPGEQSSSQYESMNSAKMEQFVHTAKQCAPHLIWRLRTRLSRNMLGTAATPVLYEFLEVAAILGPRPIRLLPAVWARWRPESKDVFPQLLGVVLHMNILTIEGTGRNALVAFDSTLLCSELADSVKQDKDRYRGIHFICGMVMQEHHWPFMTGAWEMHHFLEAWAVPRFLPSMIAQARGLWQDPSVVYNTTRRALILMDQMARNGGFAEDHPEHRSASFHKRATVDVATVEEGHRQAWTEDSTFLTESLREFAQEINMASFTTTFDESVYPPPPKVKARDPPYLHVRRLDVVEMLVIYAQQGFFLRAKDKMAEAIIAKDMAAKMAVTDAENAIVKTFNARVALFTGRFEDAIVVAKEAIDLVGGAKKVKPSDTSLQAVYTLAMTHRRTKQFDKAIEWYTFAVSLARRKGDNTMAARALAGLAMSQRDKRYFVPSRQSFSEAIQLFLWSGDDTWYKDATHGLGLVALMQADFTTARRLFESIYERAVSHFHVLNSVSGLMEVALNTEDGELFDWCLAVLLTNKNLNVGDAMGQAHMFGARWLTQKHLKDRHYLAQSSQAASAARLESSTALRAGSHNNSHNSSMGTGSTKTDGAAGSVGGTVSDANDDSTPSLTEGPVNAILKRARTSSVSHPRVAGILSMPDVVQALGKAQQAFVQGSVVGQPLTFLELALQTNLCIQDSMVVKHARGKATDEELDAVRLSVTALPMLIAHSIDQKTRGANPIPAPLPNAAAPAALQRDRSSSLSKPSVAAGVSSSSPGTTNIPSPMRPSITVAPLPRLLTSDEGATDTPPRRRSRSPRAPGERGSNAGGSPRDGSRSPVRRPNRSDSDDAGADSRALETSVTDNRGGRGMRKRNSLSVTRQSGSESDFDDVSEDDGRRTPSAGSRTPRGSRKRTPTYLPPIDPSQLADPSPAMRAMDVPASALFGTVGDEPPSPAARSKPLPPVKTDRSSSSVPDEPVFTGPAYTWRENGKLPLNAAFELLAILKVNVLPGTHKYHARSYRDCFSGRDMVTWLVQSGHASNREEAVDLGKDLQECGFIRHVVNEHDFDDSSLFYRYIL